MSSKSVRASYEKVLLKAIKLAYELRHRLNRGGNVTAEIEEIFKTIEKI